MEKNTQVFVVMSSIISVQTGIERVWMDMVNWYPMDLAAANRFETNLNTNWQYLHLAKM